MVEHVAATAGEVVRLEELNAVAVPGEERGGGEPPPMPLPMTTTSYSSSVSLAETPDLVEATAGVGRSVRRRRARESTRGARMSFRGSRGWFSPMRIGARASRARRDVTAPRRRAGNPCAAHLVVSVIDAVVAAAIVAGSTANPG